MDWVWIGFFPKRRMCRDGWVSPNPTHPDAEFPVGPPVDEVCSFAKCIASGPRTTVEDEPYNQFGGYRSAAEAWNAVTPVDRPDFAIYAYRLASRLFLRGESEALPTLGALEVAGDRSGFLLLGYDAVSFDGGHELGCSPLSCNAMANEEHVNRYCLIDEEAAAFDLARRFSISEPEPGPYAVVEVWRDETPLDR